MMQPPYPSLTPTWHNDTYPGIDPNKADLSQKEKTIVITGVVSRSEDAILKSLMGTGIGRATAITFAQAGAQRIILIGRTESTLIETQSLLQPQTCTSTVFAASVTDAAEMHQVASAVGTWDVLIMNAAYISPGYVLDANLADYWKNYETNVKSVVILSQAFLPKANLSGGSVYAIGAGAISLPPEFTPGLSAYLSSKVAQAKVIEYLAVENPKLFFCSVHSGMIDTAIFRKSGAKPESMPIDTVELAAHFLVWLSQPKTKFLSGKLVWSNWDMEELCALSEKIENSSIFTIGHDGWPFVA